ncbi:MAG TPA: hypothetical protein VIJ31_07060 [Acidothermaceae bacterium]
MTGLALHAVTAAAADTTAKNANGSLGLLVFLVLAVAVVFLLRSMAKHLKKVDKINFDDQPADATKASTPRTPGP